MKEITQKNLKERYKDKVPPNSPIILEQFISSLSLGFLNLHNSHIITSSA